MFENRQQAGEKLANALQPYAEGSPIVYALPRGGLPVAAVVADALGAPLDLILVRKIGAPGRQELAIGALVDGAEPTFILHEDIIARLGVKDAYIARAKAEALDEIERRRALYFQDRQPVSANARTGIIVDDGLATGATMEAAVESVRNAGSKAVIVAVPTAPRETVTRLQRKADAVVCLETPAAFVSVGGRYRHFPQLTDENVLRIMKEHGTREKPKESLVRRFG